MKTLVITQRKILPATDGALIDTFGLLQHLNSIGMDVTFVSFYEDDNYSEKEIFELEKYVSSVYSCKLIWKSTSLNFSFIFPNSIRKYTRCSMKKLLRKIKKEEKFDLVIIDHLQMFEYAKTFMGNRIILSSRNVESNIWHEYARKCKGLTKILVERNARLMYKYECRALKRADYVFACTNDDCCSFKDMSPECNVLLMRPFVQVPIVKNENDIRTLSNHILFIGSYGWYPNQEAAKFLVDKLMPELRKRGRVIKLFLVGKDPTKEMLSAAETYSDIIVTGKVNSVDQYIKEADIFVNAVSDGSGINIKIIEAMGKGIPIISTNYGSRGLDIHHEQEVLLYDNEKDCADRVEQLLDNREIALELSINARKCYEDFIKPSKDIDRILLKRGIE